MDTTKIVKENMEVLYRMVQELSLCGESLSEEQKSVIILNALPQEYNVTREFFECMTEPLTLKRVVEAIKAKEGRMNPAKSWQEAMLARWKPSGIESTKKQSIPRWKKGKGKKPETMNARKCYYCSKEGHYIKECRKKTFDMQGKRPDYNSQKPGNNTNSSNFVSSSFKNNYMVLAAYYENNNECWIVDSGSTLNVSSLKSWFNSLKSIEGGPISMCDGHSQNIEGIGSVPLRLHDGEIRILTDVKYVSSFKRNLISESLLTDKGLSIITKGNYKRIYKGEIEVMKAVKNRGLYVLEGKAESNLVDHVNGCTDKNASLWHNRLGHINNSYLEKLSSEGLIDNISVSKDHFCEICLGGKLHRKSFKRFGTRVEKEFDYAHANLWVHLQ